jgi:hypothetical protein
MNSIAGAAIICCALSGAAWAGPCDYREDNATLEMFYDCTVFKARLPGYQNLRQWIDAAVELCRRERVPAQDMKKCAGAHLYSLVDTGSAQQHTQPPRPAPSVAANPCDVGATIDTINQRMPDASPQTKKAAVEWWLEVHRAAPVRRQVRAETNRTRTLDEKHAKDPVADYGGARPHGNEFSSSAVDNPNQPVERSE